jgi:hypothetical protein
VTHAGSHGWCEQRGQGGEKGERTITRPAIRFRFHQIVSFGGLVYDPSTSSAAGGTPTMGRTFANYITFAFPTQGTLGTGTPITQAVTTITVK